MADQERVGRKAPWIRLVMEVLVIVAGILLAFLIDAGWDSAQESAREVEVLGSLLSEFETNRSLLPFYIEGHEQGASATRELRAMLEATPQDQLVNVPDSLLLMALLFYSFDSPSGALSSVLRSGDLQLIENRSLRELLAQWPARVADATENVAVLRGDLGPRFQDQAMRDTNLGRVLDGFGFGEPTPEAGMQKTAASPLRATTQMTSLLGLISGWLSEAAREETRLLEIADSVIALIERDIESR